MMIFQLYKKIHVHLLWAFMLGLLALTGCSDDDILYPNQTQVQLWEGDGRSVNVSLNFAAAAMEEYTNTRALDEQAERFVNDFCVAFFPIHDANHNNVVENGEIGNVAYLQYYDYDSINQLRSDAGDGKHYNQGWVSVDNVPTGTYYILGFANVESGTHEAFLSKLKAAKTWTDFQNLQVKLKQESGQVINLDRTRLCMSGSFHASGYTDTTIDEPLPVVISRAGEIDGYIHLRRLDAKVKFIIQNEIPNCTSFNLTGWKMCKVPSSAYLMERTTDAVTTYQDTDFRQFWTYMPKKDGNPYDHYDFNFYMMENRKQALHSISSYKQREKENVSHGGNAYDSQGNRVYNYANADRNSSYLVFEANMEQTMTEGGITYPRTAQMQYVVHLGYCEPKGGTEAQRASDFNTRRNSEYTYVIHIRGVNDIVVEAKRDDIDEYMNGVEGVVVDMKGGQIEQLDTHYGVFNVTLTRREIKNMLVQINSVLGSQNTTMTGSSNALDHFDDYVQNPTSYTNFLNYLTEDYQAIRIAPLGSRNKDTELVSYSETYDYDWESGSCPANSTLLPPHGEKKQVKDGSHNIPLYDLIGLKRTYGSPYSASNPQGYLDDSQSTAEGHLDEPLNFTFFINEYYYYYDGGTISKTRTLNADGTINTSSENIQEVKMWHQIANKRSHRIFRLYANTNTSTDNSSHYITGKLHIEQRAPQTYYSDKVNIAVALEHINEHHWKLIEGAGTNGSHGWSKTNSTLNGRSWGNQAAKLGEGYPAFITRNDGSGNSNYDARHGTSNSTVGHSDKWSGRTGYVPDGAHDTRKYNILDAALSRNRDLDRNNTISSVELRWYTPFENQYVDFAVGQGALETPLFRREDAAAALIGNEQVYSNRRFHYMGTNNKHVWSEEGTSVGSGVYGWEIRCCRIMGTEDYANHLTLSVPYEYDPITRIFDTRRYAETGIHRGYALSEAMLPHDNLNLQSNALPYYFKMAREDSPLQGVVPSSGPNATTQQEVLWNRMITDEYCRTYSEDPDGNDLGKWHVPNQMELALMFYGANLRPSGGYQYISSTYWWRNTQEMAWKEGEVQNQNNNWRHFMGANGGNLRMLHTGHSGGLPGAVRVRCVIDTDKSGNPAGTPEYNSPVDFQAGAFNAIYSGNNADMQVSANISAGTFQSVTIDGYTASLSGSTASVSNVPITKSTVKVTWKVSYGGKTLTYSKEFKLPARYWMISRYGVDNRYAYVDQATNHTAVGITDSRDVNEIEAIYKWILTKTTGTPVNESELNTTDTYYLYNAGTQNFISAPTSGNSSYMTVGGTPVPVKLQLRSGYDGYYVIRVNNSTNANSNGGVQNFGTWTGTDNGSTYKLTPAVLKGEMPLQFTFGSMTRTSSGYSVAITTDASATIESATIDGMTASVTGSNGNFVASITSGTIEKPTITSTWNLSRNGETYTRTKDFENKILYYVISSEAGPQQYAYADGGTNRTAADATPFTGNIRDLDANHQWVFTTTKTAVGVQPVNVNVFANLSTSYYLYNKGTGKYISGPLNNSTFGYLMIGAAEDRMRVRVEGRSGGKYSFYFAESGISNHCITTYRENPRWTNDPAVFGVFQTGGRDNPQFRFYLKPIYE